MRVVYFFPNVSLRSKLAFIRSNQYVKKPVHFESLETRGLIKRNLALVSLSSTSKVFEKHLRLGPVLTTRWSGTQTTAPATSTPTATRAHAPVLVRVAARMELDGCTVERRDGLSGMT